MLAFLPAVIALLNNTFPNYFGGPILAQNVAVCNLDRRLYYRAVSNSLSTVVRYFGTMVTNKKEDRPGDKSEHAYAELLPFIFAKWKANKTFVVLVTGTLILFGTEAVCLVLSVVSFEF